MASPPADVISSKSASSGSSLRAADITPDGRYVFLEANPSPMFMRFELDTGPPLTESLGALLIT